MCTGPRSRSTPSRQPTPTLLKARCEPHQERPKGSRVSKSSSDELRATGSLGVEGGGWRETRRAVLRGEDTCHHPDAGTPLTTQLFSDPPVKLENIVSNPAHHLAQTLQTLGGLASFFFHFSQALLHISWIAYIDLISRLDTPTPTAT